MLRKLLVDDIFLMDDDYYVDSFMLKVFLEEARRQHWPRGERLIGDTIQPVEAITRGRSENVVARFMTAQGQFIRKSGSSEALARESWVLHALDGVFPLAPRFVGRDGVAFFQTELSGTPLSDAIHDAPEKIAALFGETLKGVHALKPSLAPDPRDEWTRLQRNKGIEVGAALFSHGDWCLPNVLTDGEKITGIVDWSDGGFRDPRIDLGTGIWTLRYNLGGPSPAVEAAFLAGYEFAGSSEELEPFVLLYEGN